MIVAQHIESINYGNILDNAILCIVGGMAADEILDAESWDTVRVNRIGCTGCCTRRNGYRHGEFGTASF